MEEWRPYGSYQVSNFGNVKGKFGTLLKPSKINGYKRVAICDNGVKHMLVHRIVLLAFVGECPEGYECDHVDRNKTNNHIDNLRWVTPKENLMNRSNTRTDIEETDPRLRHNIIMKEYDTKARRAKGIQERPVGCIKKTPSGKFIGGIEINKKRYASKSLATRNEAQHYINQSVAFDWLKSLDKSEFN
jgi:hypothetical protein